MSEDRSQGTAARTGGFARRLPMAALAGAALAAAAIYLCHQAFVRGLPPASLGTLSAGLGLAGAFCVLTGVAIGGIRLLIIEPGDRFRPVSALVIALAALTVLVGLAVIGFTAGG